MADSPHMTDVTRASFAETVLNRSHQIPVLVDFWAPWCGPCRMLTPILAKLANEYGGKFFFAKVNTDMEQELAAEYKIRSIPAVKLFRNGQVVDEFVGVQPESTIRALIDRFIPRSADAVIERAKTLTHSGETQEAIRSLRDAISRDPQYDKTKVELVRILTTSLEGNDLKVRTEEARQLLGSLSIRSNTDSEIEALRARLEFLGVIADTPSIEMLKHAIEEKPDNHAARYRLAAYLALKGKYEDAMEEFLEIVRRDRAFGDDAGRKGLLTVFNLVGNRDPRVTRYRTVLARALN